MGTSDVIGSEKKVIVFDLRRPIAIYRVLNASSGQPTDPHFIGLECFSKINFTRGILVQVEILFVHKRTAAFDVKEEMMKRAARAQGDGPRPVIVGGKNTRLSLGKISYLVSSCLGISERALA